MKCFNLIISSFIFLFYSIGHANCFKSKALNSYFSKKLSLNCEDFPLELKQDKIILNGSLIEYYEEDIYRIKALYSLDLRSKKVILHGDFSNSKLTNVSFSSNSIIENTKNLVFSKNIKNLSLKSQYLKYINLDKYKNINLTLYIDKSINTNLSKYSIDSLNLIFLRKKDPVENIKLITPKLNTFSSSKLFSNNIDLEINSNKINILYLDASNLKLSLLGNDISLIDFNISNSINIDVKNKYIDNMVLRRFRGDFTDLLFSEVNIGSLIVADNNNTFYNVLSESVRSIKDLTVQEKNFEGEFVNEISNKISSSLRVIYSTKDEFNFERFKFNPNIKNIYLKNKVLPLKITKPVLGNICNVFPKLEVLEVLRGSSNDLDISTCDHLKSLSLGHGPYQIRTNESSYNLNYLLLSKVSFLSKFNINLGKQSFLSLEDVQCQRCSLSLSKNSYLENLRISNSSNIYINNFHGCKIDNLYLDGQMLKNTESNLINCIHKDTLSIVLKNNKISKLDFPPIMGRLIRLTLFNLIDLNLLLNTEFPALEEFFLEGTKTTDFYINILSTSPKLKDVFILNNRELTVHRSLREIRPLNLTSFVIAGSNSEKKRKSYNLGIVGVKFNVFLETDFLDDYRKANPDLYIYNWSTEL